MGEVIRVLEVFHGMDCGGAESMIMNIYRKLDRSKIQMDFLVHTDKKCFFDDEIQSLGGKIYRMPYYNGVNGFAYEKAVNSFFSDHKEIGIVHAHLGSCAYIYLRIAKKHGCYTIVHSHNTKPVFSIKSLLYRINTLKVRRIADYFIGCSEAAGRYRFGDYIVDHSGRYSTLKNAIDTERFLFNSNERNRVRTQYGIDKEMVIGHVGRFSYQKNHELLIDIFAKFLETHPNSRLIMIGDGSLKQQIEKKVKDLRLEEYVIFAGIQNNVYDYLQSFDCFVFPSFYEGLPVSVIEAQASGLPCIVSSNITKEVCVTDLVSFVSIEDDLQVWVNRINASITVERVNRKKDIVDSGYDIKTTTEWLTKMYLANNKTR